MRFWNIGLLSATLTLLPLGTNAQATASSIFSAYGLGDLTGSTQVAQMGMGRSSVALYDPYSVMQGNPASYAQLGGTVFEGGGQGVLLWQRTAQEVQRRSVGRVNGLSVGIPFAKGRWGLALGLSPFSDIGYLASDEGTLPDGGVVRYNYSGEGGLSNAFLGLAREVWGRSDSLGKKSTLSIGANFNYLFGRVDGVRKAYYPQGLGYANTNSTGELVLRDPFATVGARWRSPLHHPARKGVRTWYGSAGLTLDLPTALSARRTNLLTNFFVGSSGVEFTGDTLYQQSGAKGTVSLPPQIGFGVGLDDGEHWTATAEVRYRDWTRVDVDVPEWTLPAPLGTEMAVAAGVAWRPAGDGTGSIFKRTTYRLGTRLGQDYLVVRGAQLKLRAYQAGLSLPILRTLSHSRVNLGAEWAERGSTGSGLRETALTIMAGVTISPDVREVWFRKRRIE
jgi:hypothetical protein